MRGTIFGISCPALPPRLSSHLLAHPILSFSIPTKIVLKEKNRPQRMKMSANSETCGGPKARGKLEGRRYIEIFAVWANKPVLANQLRNEFRRKLESLVALIVTFQDS